MEQNYCVPSKSPLFNLGSITVTPGVMNLISSTTEELVPFISAHVHGNWGELCEHDIEVNRQALEHQSRILSVYFFNGERIYIITSACRTETTILLPEEY